MALAGEKLYRWPRKTLGFFTRRGLFPGQKQHRGVGASLIHEDGIGCIDNGLLSSGLIGAFANPMVVGARVAT